MGLDILEVWVNNSFSNEKHWNLWLLISKMESICIPGFVTYADVCEFDRHHIFATKVFDSVTCSPYISAGFEWISYEDERSVKCKTNFVIEGDFGGVMTFSLNTDDYSSSCYYGDENGHDRNDHTFPLTNAIRDLLFTKN